jgi:ubiquinone/menaquinone biosynthesis C-methylase UbiE
MAHMRAGTKNTHKMAGVFRRRANNLEYDFGWGFALRWGFLIGCISFLTMSVGTLIVNRSLYILSCLLFLVALQLFMGDLVLRHIHNINSELVLPYVDLLPSENNLVLDAGCGSGRTSIAVSKILKNGKIIAVDKFDAPYIDDGGKKLLEKNLKVANITDKVEIQTQDITALKFEKETFDAAVSSYAIDHLGKDKLKALKEINRVLKKDGKLLMIIMLPNYAAIMVLNIISIFLLTSRKKWNQLFKEAKFTCIDSGDLNGGHYFLLEKAT